MAPLLTLDEAQASVLAVARPLAAELVPISAAAGRVAAEDVRAQVDLPPFASSAMDGFAVRSEDLPGELEIAGESAAGSPYEGQLEPGTAVTISTGAVVPDGSDAVVPIEYVVQTEYTVQASQGLAAGANVRPPGSDVASGELVVPSGARLTPARVAAAAAAGLAAVTCYRRPRVSVLAIGSPPERPDARCGSPRRG